MRNLRKIDAADVLGPETEVQPNPSAVLGLADGSQAEVASPARTLQQRLADDLQAEADGDDGTRWAPRTTLFFSVGASLTVWAVIALGIAAFR
jgi:hypothetical protein